MTATELVSQLLDEHGPTNELGHYQGRDDNTAAGWEKREGPAIRAAGAWKELASKEWPSDNSEARKRAAQLNRYQLIMNGYSEEEVAAMSDNDVNVAMHDVMQSQK